MIATLLLSMIAAPPQTAEPEVRTGVDAVREHFNAQAQKPRFVTLLSPT